MSVTSSSATRAGGSEAPIAGVVAAVAVEISHWTVEPTSAGLLDPGHHSASGRTGAPIAGAGDEAGCGLEPDPAITRI